MGSRSGKILKMASIVFGVAVLICVIYIMASGAGLQDGLDFGAGAYYYADIPEFERFLAWDSFKERFPYIVYVLLFLLWGALMFWLWKWIDKKK